MADVIEVDSPNNTDDDIDNYIDDTNYTTMKEEKTNTSTNTGLNEEESCEKEMKHLRNA